PQHIAQAALIDRSHRDVEASHARKDDMCRTVEIGRAAANFRLAASARDCALDGAEIGNARIDNRHAVDDGAHDVCNLMWPDLRSNASASSPSRSAFLTIRLPLPQTTIGSCSSGMR